MDSRFSLEQWALALLSSNSERLSQTLSHSFLAAQKPAFCPLHRVLFSHKPGALQSNFRPAQIRSTPSLALSKNAAKSFLKFRCNTRPIYVQNFARRTRCYVLRKTKNNFLYLISAQSSIFHAFLTIVFRDASQEPLGNRDLEVYVRGNGTSKLKGETWEKGEKIANTLEEEGTNTMKPPTQSDPFAGLMKVQAATPKAKDSKPNT